MAIDPKNIDEIKNLIDIVDVIGDFVSLKKSGQNYKALSPFTNEKTPSFFVSPSKGIFKCFSSGKGGDAISFIMEYDGLNYIEAIKYLGKKYGVEVVEEDLTDEQIIQQNERDSLFIILNQACEYYKEKLWKNDEGKNIGLSYLKERQIKEELIKKFELGYSLENWDDFYQWALKKGFDEELVEKAGLLIRKDEKKYDRFRGRVIFPIHNLTGKIIAFGARTLKKDPKIPKYVNSPESDVYHKSNALYGLHLAKKAIRDEENCYLVEGYTDVIALHQNSVENVVASSGTSLTEEQIKLMKRYSDNVTILFDGDEAGLKASIRGLDMLLEGGLNVKIVVFPEGEDPDSYSRKAGVNEFRNYLSDQAKDFIRFKLDLLTSQAADDPVKKAETIKDIVNSISKIPDPVKRTVYIKESGKILDIDEEILIAEQNKIIIKKRRSKKTKVIPTDEILQTHVVAEAQEIGLTDRETLSLQEKEFIRILINYGKDKISDDRYAYEYLINEIEDIEFPTPVYKQIFITFKNELKNGNIIGTDFLLAFNDTTIQNEVVNLVAYTEKYVRSKYWDSRYKIHVPHEKEDLGNTMYKNITRLKHHYVKNMIKDHKMIIKQKEEEMEDKSEFSEIEKLQKEYLELKKADMEFTTVLGTVVD